MRSSNVLSSFVWQGFGRLLFENTSSNANLLKRESNLYFMKLVLFPPYLASVWLKITGRLDVLQNKSTAKLTSLTLWKNLLESLTDLFCRSRPMTPASSNFAKQIKKTLHKRKQHLFLLKKGKILYFFKDQGRSLIKRSRKEPKNLLIETSTRVITLCTVLRLDCMNYKRNI